MRSRTARWPASRPNELPEAAAHDLRHGLGLVAGHADAALQALDRTEPDLAAARAALHCIVLATIDGTALLGSGRSECHQEAVPIPVQDLLRTVARLTAPRWRRPSRHHIDVHVTVDDSPHVLGWPALLRRALVNLVLNAVDALPQGGRIVLGGHQDGDTITLEVADSGMGISEVARQRVLRSGSAGHRGSGTGLGLTVVAMAVERHRGTLQVDTGPGQGTTFRLTLPAAPPSPPPVPAERPQSTWAGRVLLVEDDPALGHLAAAMLRRSGLAVTVASSGEQALEHLAVDSRYHVVLADLSLGWGMDGWQLAGAIHSRYPALAVALATGWADAVDVEVAHQRGIAAVIGKPYSASEIEALVQQRQASAALPSA